MWQTEAVTTKYMNIGLFDYLKPSFRRVTYLPELLIRMSTLPLVMIPVLSSRDIKIVRTTAGRENNNTQNALVFDDAIQRDKIVVIHFKNRNYLRQCRALIPPQEPVHRASQRPRSKEFRRAGVAGNGRPATSTSLGNWHSRSITERRWKDEFLPAADGQPGTSQCGHALANGSVRRCW